MMLMMTFGRRSSEKDSTAACEQVAFKGFSCYFFLRQRDVRQLLPRLQASRTVGG